ncbi:hypothetical protein [Thalassoglobus sp.]|uniref:hypothetical protein n=1 Tax=Thalassoglobus sp. TaxID=2795869 RepID=UPI003AA8ED02
MTSNTETSKSLDPQEVVPSDVADVVARFSILTNLETRRRKEFPLINSDDPFAALHFQLTHLYSLMLPFD